jgi:hypothetical protein
MRRGSSATAVRAEKRCREGALREGRAVTSIHLALLTSPTTRTLTSFFPNMFHALHWFRVLDECLPEKYTSIIMWAAKREGCEWGSRVGSDARSFPSQRVHPCYEQEV